jgi:tetratricopeptide (TPR) repeat protein
VDLEPGSAENHLALADALASFGNNQAALLEYIECLKLRKDWLPALLGLGKSASLGDLRNYTFAAYKRAAQVDPKSADAWIGLGGVALQTGVEFKDAIADFEKATQCDTRRTDFYTDYADALRRDSQWDRAEKVLRQRLAVDNKDAVAHYMLGMVLMDLRPTPDRLKEAEAESRLALQLSPNNPLVNLQLGQLFLSSGRTAEALDAIQKALAVHPLDYKANVVLANAYRRSGNTAMADKVASKAASVYHDLERIKVLEPEERKNPQDIKVREELAKLYDNTGNQSRAAQEQAIIHALKANPASSATAAKTFADDLHNVLPTY